MNEVEKNLCERILTALFRRPVSRLFWNHQGDIANPAVARPYSLLWVSSRLAEDCYSSPGDLVRDLRVCFQNGKAGASPGSIRYGAAQQMLADLDVLVTTFHPSASLVVFPISVALADFEEVVAVPSHQSMQRSISEQPPGSQLFQTESDPSDFGSLIRDIKLLSCSDLTAKLAVLVKNLQPEAVSVTTDVSFNIGIMTDETRRAVRQYVTELLHDAAIGKFDPFGRPFGHRFTPIRIQERGGYLRSGTH
jgi:hypothetical protein